MIISRRMVKLDNGHVCWRLKSYSAKSKWESLSSTSLCMNVRLFVFVQIVRLKRGETFRPSQAIYRIKSQTKQIINIRCGKALGQFKEVNRISKTTKSLVGSLLYFIAFSAHAGFCFYFCFDFALFLCFWVSVTAVSAVRALVFLFHVLSHVALVVLFALCFPFLFPPVALCVFLLFRVPVLQSEKRRKHWLYWVGTKHKWGSEGLRKIGPKTHFQNEAVSLKPFLWKWLLFASLLKIIFRK